MRKRFTRKPQGDEPATQGKNYKTPSGLQRLTDEHRFLLTRERPAVMEVVAWAAGNGDRSDNADYRHGKRQLRQIDGRIRFLTKRIEAAEVLDPEAPRTGQSLGGNTLAFEDVVLLAPQRHHRVDLGCSPSGDITGQQSDSQKEQGNAGERHRVARADAE